LRGKAGGGSDELLYFVDQPQRLSSSTTQLEPPAAHVLAHTFEQADVTISDKEQKQERQTEDVPTQHSTAPLTEKPRAREPLRLSTAKNLALLVELHCAHDHWNFEDVARQYSLTMPDPRPDCWACMCAKARAITHDKVSTRDPVGPYEIISADCKGPIMTPTPEGFKYFFLLTCLFSHFYWIVLVKTMNEWAAIWPTFVRRAQAKSGKIACLITDAATLMTQKSISTFNDLHGIEGVSSAPYSQWQDPVERGNQTVASLARASMIHGGARGFMWGSACIHATASTNRMHPPKPVPGHEGKSRLRIIDPTMTLEKEMRNHKPFLCLGFVRINITGSNFKPRNEPCVHLYYNPSKKAYALLTVPNLYLLHSVEVRFVTTCYPLRVTNHFSNKMDAFMRPSDEDEAYSSVHGPRNIMRKVKPQETVDSGLVIPTPVLLATPGAPAVRRSSRHKWAPTQFVSVTRAVFTPDQLALRTPRSTTHAVTGPDREFWVSGVLKDFKILRDKKCFINITDVKPPGPTPLPQSSGLKSSTAGPSSSH